jgi:hypothetical protein
MKHVSYILGITLSLFLGFALELVCTAGHAVEFHNYNIVSWIFQILWITILVCLGIMITHEETKQ